MKLFMTELTVSDVDRSVAWYRDRFGFRVELLDAANGFALLNSAGGRLALKRGSPVVASVTFHFAVTDLDGELARLLATGVQLLSPIQASHEGYRRAFVADPDGYKIGVFQFASGTEVAKQFES